MDPNEMETRFTYHPPREGQPARYEEIRGYAKAVAQLIDTHCPDNREKALAFTYLEQAVMWANASIARREGGDANADTTEGVGSDGGGGQPGAVGAGRPGLDHPVF